MCIRDRNCRRSENVKGTRRNTQSNAEGANGKSHREIDSWHKSQVWFVIKGAARDDSSHSVMEPRVSNCTSTASSSSNGIIVQLLLELILITFVVIATTVKAWHIRNKRRRARQTTSLQHESADEEVPTHSETHK